MTFKEKIIAVVVYAFVAACLIYASAGLLNKRINGRDHCEQVPILSVSCVWENVEEIFGISPY